MAYRIAGDIDRNAIGRFGDLETLLFPDEMVIGAVFLFGGTALLDLVTADVDTLPVQLGEGEPFRRRLVQLMSLPQLPALLGPLLNGSLLGVLPSFDKIRNADGRQAGLQDAFWTRIGWDVRNDLAVVSAIRGTDRNA